MPDTPTQAPPQPPESPESSASPTDNRFVLFGNAHEARRPDPGLYLVSTPIGNLGDITLRAIETLATADLIACEDTRMTRRLLDRYGIHTAMTAYHEHNAARQRPRLMAALQEGKIVALVSDAGTPLVSDPGYRLVTDAVAAGLPVIPLPGACAALAALVVAGLPSDTFVFAGFLPTKGGARHRRIAEIGAMQATAIFYESPNRLAATLADMAADLGPERPAVVARELTKRFETVVRAPLGDLAERFSGESVKGEIVILVGPPDGGPAKQIDVDAALTEALTRLGPSGAASEVSKATGLNRRELYKRVLAMKTADGGEAEEQ